MSGSKLFLDTNIIIYLLNGDKTLEDLLHKKTTYISFISQLELLGYQEITSSERIQVVKFLEQCVIIDINQAIKDQAIYLRKKYKLRLPDSIILGTAISPSIPLISADKDFEKIKEASFLYYEK